MAIEEEKVEEEKKIWSEKQKEMDDFLVTIKNKMWDSVVVRVWTNHGQTGDKQEQTSKVHA